VARDHYRKVKKTGDRPKVNAANVRTAVPGRERISAGSTPGPEPGR
jgi:hypothetical protein